MEHDVRDEPRPSNDSRKRKPVAPGKVETIEKKPSFGQRWSAVQPTKMILFWACIASIILTIVIGFTWGGWVSAGGAQKAAETMAKDAVVQRLVPICVAQFSQDPDKSLKLDEMNEMTSYQGVQFVQEQGWATIYGDDKPDRRVADACTKLLLEMSP
jgi:hypothetical protein